MGKIKAVVLNAKNGVITEERFQKLTNAQWLFHYHEVMAAKEEELNKLKVIVEHLKLVGTMANPKAGKALKEAEELAKAQKEIDANNFHEVYQEIAKETPDVIRVSARPRGSANKFVLPVYKRNKDKKKPGISISKSEGGGK